MTRPPDWLSVSPALRANYYWSGTRTLIVTADPESPLPYATEYAVTVAGSARSVAGRAIASAYRLKFTTPTVKLLGASWYRKAARADSPAVMALRFNQAVRAEDVIAHTTARYTLHTWNAPVMSPAVRERLLRDDPAGLGLFDQKVARIASVVASSDRIPIQLATSWDEKRFPRADNVVVVETTGVPSTDGWITIATDAQMPSPGGAVRAAELSTVVRLEPTFFANPQCFNSCAPGYSSVAFRRGVAIEALTAALTISALDSAGTPTRIPTRERSPIGWAHPSCSRGPT